MKKQTKGLILTGVFGGSLLFWATAATLPGIMPEDPEAVITPTGTPLDNYPDVQRARFCDPCRTRTRSARTPGRVPC